MKSRTTLIVTCTTVALYTLLAVAAMACVKAMAPRGR
jgi:hypothetical protein